MRGEEILLSELLRDRTGFEKKNIDQSMPNSNPTAPDFAVLISIHFMWRLALRCRSNSEIVGWSRGHEYGSLRWQLQLRVTTCI